MWIILELSCLISALLSGPLFFTLIKISLEFSIVFANNSLGWIIETISDIVCSFWDTLWTIDIIANQSLAIWPQTFQLLSIESSILYGTVVPVFVFELKVIVEEVFTF